MGVPAGAAGQLTVPAAQTRLADLAVGQLYRVQITDIFPGKAEFLLGNQYLLAATPFRFQTGDVVNLRLAALTSDLLTFQLILPAGADSAQTASDLATLMRAASLPDTPANRAALLTLVNAGITVNSRTMGEVAQLLAAVPAESVAAFLPLYKDLVAKGLRPEAAVLEQLARLSGGAPELAGLLSQSLDGLRRRRPLRGGRELLEEAVEAALTTLEREEDLPTARLLRNKMRLLYGSPERRLFQALAGLVEAGGGPGAETEPATLEVELDDLANLAMGAQVPPALVAALNMLQAIRLQASLDPALTELALPMEMDGELTEVRISINVLAEQCYQKDYAMRVRVENSTQGRVEIQLRTRGPGLTVDVLSDRPEVLSTYEAQFDRFRAAISDNTAFFVRRLAATPQSL